MAEMRAVLRSEIAELRSTIATKEELSALELRLSGKMSAMFTKVIIWLVGTAIASISLMAIIAQLMKQEKYDYPWSFLWIKQNSLAVPKGTSRLFYFKGSIVGRHCLSSCLIFIHPSRQTAKVFIKSRESQFYPGACGFVGYRGIDVEMTGALSLISS